MLPRSITDSSHPPTWRAKGQNPWLFLLAGRARRPAAMPFAEIHSVGDRHAAREGAELADTNPERQPEAKRACRVLVVDDDELARAWLAAQLEGAQFEVEVAGSGQEALRL